MKETLLKINYLITKRQRNGLIILSILLFFGMILEVFGLGILVPTLSILLDPEAFKNSQKLYSIRLFFSSYSDQSFLMFFFGTVIILYLFKTFFLVFLAFVQNRFLSNLTQFVSIRLYESYLGQPYSFHLKKNASELIKNIQIEVTLFSAFLMYLLTIIIEVGLIVAVIFTLIYIEPIGAISLGLFLGISSIIFFQFTKKKMEILGKERQELELNISKISLESFGGIKDLLISGKEKFFANSFRSVSYKRARVSTLGATISVLPRFFLELITVLGLLGFIIIMIFQGQNTVDLITILGVFAAATFRIIPSLNRTLTAFQNLKFNYPSLEIIFSEIKSYKRPEEKFKEQFKDISFESMIEFKNINFSYEEGSEILSSLNLTVQKSSIIGIIGKSGSGKSTLIDLLVGLHKPVKGTILVDGVNINNNIKNWREKIGYVSQNVYLLDDTIKKNIALGVKEEEININLILKIINQVQLTEFIDSKKTGLNTIVGEKGVQLSGGQIQRIGLARALYNKPKLLVLDEATSSLDSLTEEGVMGSIKKLKGKITIIIIAHRLTTLKDCDKIFELKGMELTAKTLNKT